MSKLFGVVHSIAFVCQLNLLFGQALEKNPRSQRGCGELPESTLPARAIKCSQHDVLAQRQKQLGSSSR